MIDPSACHGRAASPHAVVRVGPRGEAHRAHDRIRVPAVSTSVRNDVDGIAVRAHRTPLPQGRGDRPRRTGPHVQRTADRTTSATPDPRWPARTGEAGDQRGIDPDGDRVRGSGRVGENVGDGADGAIEQHGHGHDARRDHGTTAGADDGRSDRHGRRRPGPPGTGGRTPRAMIGSGHCLQSRISHDSFLDGYDW